STPKTYTCLQSADNGTSETSVGGKFESCAISGTVMASVSATTLNSYNMYRETIDTGAFTYSGACSIVVSAASPTITATFDCNKMVQTIVTDRKRFPMSGAPTGTLKGEFKCTF
ncbi:MAG: hypothetical protein NT027_06795, partial [Proteobacteria bacterium]|nr:hypothetical protein [Pseudomonadota bacterium]